MVKNGNDSLEICRVLNGMWQANDGWGIINWAFYSSNEFFSAEISSEKQFPGIKYFPCIKGRELRTYSVFAVVCLLLVVYCAVDPFDHCVISGFPEFKAFKVEMSAWSEIPVEKDTENLLQKSKIKFSNQVQGPESVAFDPMGHGPYTGVPDGRIVLWDGEKSNDFAYTSANRVNQK